jgi:hypothetical protein
MRFTISNQDGADIPVNIVRVGKAWSGSCHPFGSEMRIMVEFQSPYTHANCWVDGDLMTTMMVRNCPTIMNIVENLLNLTFPDNKFYTNLEESHPETLQSTLF